jgi:anti-anti-sigma regulatory factor
MPTDWHARAASTGETRRIARGAARKLRGMALALSAAMLRIHRNDVMTHRVVLLLQGFIVAEWAEVLERECAELLGAGLPVTLDLSGVSFVGRSGIEVLKRAQAGGVRIVGCSPLIAATLEHEGIEAQVRGTRPGNGEDQDDH